MAILEKEVLVGLGGGNHTYYEELGYEIPRYLSERGHVKIKQGTHILVKVKNLPDNSQVKVTKICDDCGGHTPNQPYYAITASRKEGDGEDRCYQCGSKRRGDNRKNNVIYEKSLECWAKENKKEYLLTEFSLKNSKKPSQISYGSNDDYWWKCSKCNGEYQGNLSNRTALDRNCPFCAGRSVLKGFNDIWTTHPQVAKILANPEVGYKITKGVSKKVEFTCPDCGNINKKTVLHVIRQGFSCPKCSDGISYPEKFMFSTLSQLNLIFETQKVFKWSKNVDCENTKLNGKKKYDFYIPSLNCIIETHGEQHYKESFASIGGRSVKEESENDILKVQLAKDNGIEKYIIIDSRHSNLEWMKNAIIDSEISAIFNLSNINWRKAHEFSCNSLVKEVCELWDSGVKSTLKISSLIGLHFSTVTKYLKQGKILGWCDYDGQEVIRKKIMQLTKNGEFIKEWSSATEAEINLGIYRGGISSVCKEKKKTAGGFKWIHKEDYLSMIKENDLITTN